MCTIMTISREYYIANRTSVQARARQDADYNPHGASLLLIGMNPDDTVLLRSLNTDVILTILDLHMLQGKADRAWLHFRYATTGYEGINGCHGFAAGDYTVFHNGILTRQESSGFAVDSELIAFDVEAYGKDKAIARLFDTEHYANVFLVNNQTGAFDVVRLQTGTLYTDGQGNYSTTATGTIVKPVEHYTIERHDTEIVVPYAPAKSLFSGKVAPLDEDEWMAADYDSVLGAIDSLLDVQDLDDLYDLAVMEGWYNTGVPREVYDAMEAEIQMWTKLLHLWVQRDQSALALVEGE